MFVDFFYGKWIIMEVFGDFVDVNEGMIYEFMEEGIFMIEKGLFFNEGIYVKNDMMIMVDLNGVEINYLYIFGN